MAQVDRLGRVLVTVVVVVVVVLVCPAGRAQLVWCLLPCIPAEEEPAICRACSMIESNWFGKKVLWFFFLLLLLLLVRKQQRRRVVFRLRIQWAKLASIQRLVVEVGNGIPIPIPIPRFESDRPPLSCVCRFRVWCLHATAATATPPLIGAKPLNSKEIAFHPVFSFQDDGLMAESSSVFQSLPGGRCTREALGRTGENPCERSIQNTARLMRTRFRIGKKREEVDTFLRPGKGGQGNACKGMGSV